MERLGKVVCDNTGKPVGTTEQEKDYQTIKKKHQGAERSVRIEASQPSLSST